MRFIPWGPLERHIPVVVSTCVHDDTLHHNTSPYPGDNPPYLGIFSRYKIVDKYVWFLRILINVVYRSINVEIDFHDLVKF